MDRTDTLQCPHCHEEFTREEAAWTVCLTCGEIFPPGEDWGGHGPGPTYEETEYSRRIVEWPCNHALTVYSEEAALDKQAEVREDENEDDTNEDAP